MSLQFFQVRVDDTKRGRFAVLSALNHKGENEQSSSFEIDARTTVTELAIFGIGAFREMGGKVLHVFAGISTVGFAVEFADKPKSRFSEILAEKAFTAN